MAQTLRVAFVGLGNMGEPMARNLLRAGFPLTVWNRTAGRADALVRDGAQRAPDVAAAVGSADAVITMVADDAALEAVVRDGLDERLPAGGVHVSMSTISVALAERLVTAHQARGQRFVSAPVFGRPDAAAAAKLFIVAAGDAAAIARCRPLFDAMGQRTFLFGESAPAAAVAKLSGNFLIAAVIETLGEAFALTRKSGIDPHAYLDMLTNTLFGAPIYKTYGTLIADQRFRPAGFRLPLGLKDVSLALDAARAKAVPMPVASVVRDHMLEALAQGRQDDDWSAVADIVARNAGL